MTNNNILILNLNWIKGCGGQLRGPTGVIEVSNVADLYVSSYLCTWNVTVRPGKTILVKFIAMQMLSYENANTHDSCTYSYVMVSLWTN